MVAGVPNVYLRTDLLHAGFGSYRLLSDCPTCASALVPRPISQIEISPGFAGASTDFSHVTFESHQNLTREAEGEGVKLYESVDGVVRLAGILPDGKAAEESIAGRGAMHEVNKYIGGNTRTGTTISADGSRIVFTANPVVEPKSSFGLDVGEAYGGNLYLREDGTGTVQLNASERSVPDPYGWQPAVFMGASRDDSKVFFVTPQALADEDTDPEGGISGNSALDLYMYDVNAPAGHHLTLITHGPKVPNNEAPVAFVPGISEDGSYVYFTNRRIERLYVWHDGAIRYIAESGEYPVDWGQTPITGGFTADEFRMTPDGKHAAFMSKSAGMAEQFGYDNSSKCLHDFAYGTPCGEVYLYSYDSNKLVCASCKLTGEPVMNFSELAFNSEDSSVDTVTQHLSRPLTVDGSKLFFTTAEPLVRADTNGMKDVYEYDANTGKASLISSGRSAEDSIFLEATPDGSDVFFTTSEQLVRMEFDNNFDVYDARIDGGIPAQNVARPAQCEGDDCQGPAKTALVFSLPSSLTFEGRGNMPSSALKRVIASRSKRLTRTQKLRRALMKCRQEHGRKRRVCERRARRRFMAAGRRTAASAARGH